MNECPICNLSRLNINKSLFKTVKVTDVHAGKQFPKINPSSLDQFHISFLKRQYIDSLKQCGMLWE